MKSELRVVTALGPSSGVTQSNGRVGGTSAASTLSHTRTRLNYGTRGRGPPESCTSPIYSLIS